MGDETSHAASRQIASPAPTRRSPIHRSPLGDRGSADSERSADARIVSDAVSIIEAPAASAIMSLSGSAITELRSGTSRGSTTSGERLVIDESGPQAL